MSDLFEGEPTLEAKFEDLVGEGKKYQDPDALAKKAVHADKHIENLETELAELRTELKARTSIEEMLGKIEPRTPPIEERDSGMPDTRRQEPELDNTRNEVNLEEEVTRLLKAERDKERREANISTVRKELKDRFGPDYNQHLGKIAEKLEVSKDFLTGMAQTSPSGFLKLVDSVEKPEVDRPVAPPDSTTSFGLNPKEGKRNAEFYRELRKKDLNAYFSRKVQNQMHKDRMALGDAFYN